MDAEELRCVYYPDEDTFLLVDAIIASEKGRTLRPRVLEVGTGSGAVLGAMVEHLAPSLAIGIDLNPTACRVAGRTIWAVVEAQTGQPTDGRILHGSLFEPLGPSESIFDIIAFNPPYVPSGPEVTLSGMDLALNGGENGREAIDQFLRGLPLHLAPGLSSACYMVCIEANDPRSIQCKCSELGLRAVLIASKRLPSELLHILRITQ